MNPRRKSRLYLAMVVVIGAVVTLTLYALRANIDLFYTPSEILGGKGEAHQLPHIGQRLRIGGLVMPGSVKRDPQTLQVTFKIYDAAGAVAVNYVGILPDLFREGQGVVAQGILAPGNRVEAHEVLAKHDEKYTPPEVASALAPARRPATAAMLTAAAPAQTAIATDANARPTAPSGFQPQEQP